MNRTPDLRCFTTEPHIDFADLSCMQDACHMTVCGSVVECRSAESGIRNPESGIWNLRFDSSWELKIFFFFPRPWQDEKNLSLYWKSSNKVIFSQHYGQLIVQAQAHSDG